MWHVRGRTETHRLFCFRKMKERGRGADGRIIFKWILKKQDGMAWTGFVCLRIGTRGGYL